VPSALVHIVAGFVGVPGARPCVSARELPPPGTLAPAADDTQTMIDVSARLCGARETRCRRPSRA
jgi:hypothetical protein